MKKFAFHKYIYIFFATSMLGWFGEVLFSILVHHELVNPGTLCGMWCPIYGVACVFIALLLKKEDGCIQNFVKITCISLVVEYISAFISEEFFSHRLWDYSTFFLNFQGRICLSMGILFGMVGFFFSYLLLPKLYIFFEKNERQCIRLNFVFLFFFLANIVIECMI